MFLVADAIAFAVGLFLPRFVAPRWVYGVVLGAGLLAAHIQLLAQSEKEKGVLEKHIAELRRMEADIRLQVKQTHFGPPTGSVRSPGRDLPGYDRGFSSQGLPHHGELYARINVRNVGYEPGRLMWELDPARTKLPSLFDQDRIKCDFHATKVDARGEFEADLFVYLLLGHDNPKAVARRLREIAQSNEPYVVIMSYWTHRVDGDTDPQELRIQADMRQFYEKIVDHRHKYGFASLEKLADLEAD